MARGTSTKHEASTARRKTAFKATTTAPRLSPTLAEANTEHQLEAGLAATTPSHQHDRQHVHAARAPPAKRPVRTKATQAERFDVPPACFTISSFCTAHDLSEAMFHKLRSQGRAPRLLRVGTRVLITFEAAAEWRAKMEQATAAAPAAEDEQCTRSEM